MPSPKTYSQKINNETKKLLKDIVVRYKAFYKVSVFDILSGYMLNESLSVAQIKERINSLSRVRSFDELEKSIIELTKMIFKKLNKVNTLNVFDFEVLVTNMGLSVYLLFKFLNYCNGKNVYSLFTTYQLTSRARKLNQNFYALLLSKTIEILTPKFKAISKKKLPMLETVQEHLDFLVDEYCNSKKTARDSNAFDRLVQVLSRYYRTNDYLISDIAPTVIKVEEIPNSIKSLTEILNACFKTDYGRFSGLFFQDFSDVFEIKGPKGVKLIDLRWIEQILFDIAIDSSKRGIQAYARYLLANRIKKYKLDYRIEDFEALGYGNQSKKALTLFKEERLKILNQCKWEIENIESYSKFTNKVFDNLTNASRGRPFLIREIAKRLKRGQ